MLRLDRKFEGLRLIEQGSGQSTGQHHFTSTHTTTTTLSPGQRFRRIHRRYHFRSTGIIDATALKIVVVAADCPRPSRSLQSTSRSPQLRIFRHPDSSRAADIENARLQVRGTATDTPEQRRPSWP